MAEDDEKGFGEEHEEDDVYGAGTREELEEAEEISPEEEGFMEGYEEGDKVAKCSMCGKVLLDSFVEREIDNEIYRFCSGSCVDEYMRKMERGRKKAQLT